MINIVCGVLCILWGLAARYAYRPSAPPETTDAGRTKAVMIRVAAPIVMVLGVIFIVIGLIQTI